MRWLGNTRAWLFWLIVSQLSELVQDGVRDSRRVATKLSRCHGLLRAEETVGKLACALFARYYHYLPSQFHKRLLLAGLFIEALVRLDNLDHPGTIGMLFSGILDVWPEREIGMGAIFCSPCQPAGF